MFNELHKKHIKVQYHKNFKPCVFSKGDLVLLHGQESDKLGLGMFEPMWLGPYIVKHVLGKGIYELFYFAGFPLAHPRNGIYLVFLCSALCTCCI